MKSATFSRGSVDAADFAPFNGDPQTLYRVVENPLRIHVLAPGEPFTLHRLIDA